MPQRSRNRQQPVSLEMSESRGKQKMELQKPGETSGPLPGLGPCSEGEEKYWRVLSAGEHSLIYVLTRCLWLLS